MTKVKLLVFIVILVLFLTPFFWMRPGEINLGGDSSRLYFFDPYGYLTNIAFFGVNPWETGSVMISYFYVPFVSFLLILKNIFVSTSFLINFYNGASLAIAFISVYLFIIELLRDEENGIFKELGSIGGALLYVLTPVLGTNWDKALITHNHLFLNPLISYLALVFLLRNNTLAGLSALLVTFIFAPNFSYTSAPPFFAFYPLMLLFIFIYVRFIRKKSIPIAKPIIFLILFIVLHFFHFLPQATLFFDSTSEEYFRAISAEGKSQAASQYAATYPYVSLTNSLLSLPQLKLISHPTLYTTRVDFLFVVFILVVIGGLAVKTHFKKDRLTLIFLVSTVFFLITLFFMSGNITLVGVSIYHSLFMIPGFSMFRNFVGQFSYVFFSFYAIVFGLGMYSLLSFSKYKKLTIVFYVGCMGLVLLNGRQVLSGAMVNLPIYGATDISVPFKMDPNFEKVLEFFKNDKSDYKVLTLPFNDYSYQLLSGVNKGMYIGPSMIGGLTGKNDFTSYKAFPNYSDDILNAFKQEDFPRILGVLHQFNIKYIYYNANEKIYEPRYFSNFPYEQTRLFMPTTQSSFKEFLNKFSLKKSATYGSHTIYQVEDVNFLPHVYTAQNISYLNNQKLLSYVLDSKENTSEISVGYYAERIDPKHAPFIDKFYIEAEQKSPYADFFTHRKNSQFSTPHPVHMPSSRMYPLVIMNENARLSQYKKQNFDTYYDFAINLAEKRFMELAKWKEYYSFHENVHSLEDMNKISLDVSIGQLLAFSNSMYWEDVIARYRKHMLNLINDIETPNDSEYSSQINKTNLIRSLSNHQNLLLQSIYGSNLSQEKHEYLMRIGQLIFSEIAAKLAPQDPSINSISYLLKDLHAAGNYHVYVEKTPLQNFSPSDIRLTFGGKRLTPKEEQEGEWIQYENINIDDIKDTNIFLEYENNENIAQNTGPWQLPIQNLDKKDDLVIIEENEENNKNITSGVTKELNNINSNTIYRLSFDYKTNNNPFIFRVYQRNSNADLVLLLDRQLISTDWQGFTQIIQIGSNIDTVILNVLKGSGSSVLSDTDNNKIDIRNLSLVKIPHPRIILVHENETGTNKNLPIISFQKINPTKYHVDVKNAKGPFALISLDQFNDYWKIYKTSNKIVEKHSLGSYLNNRVTEIEGKNQLISLDMKKGKQLAVDKHFIANGYANAWYITPEDVGTEQDYSLIVELDKQNQFYFAGIVSIIGVIIIIIWAFIILFRRIASSHR